MGPLRTSQRGHLRLLALASAAVLAALALAAVAWAANDHAIAGGHYSGKTSQNQATTIVVSANGKTITKLDTAVSYDHLCTKGTNATFAIAATNVPITNGSFGVRAAGKGPKKSSINAIVTGTFTGSTVAGTVAEYNGHCAAPRQVENPYLSTFTAKNG